MRRVLHLLLYCVWGLAALMRRKLRVQTKKASLYRLALV